MILLVASVLLHLFSKVDIFILKTKLLQYRKHLVCSPNIMGRLKMLTDDISFFELDLFNFKSFFILIT